MTLTVIIVIAVSWAAWLIVIIWCRGRWQWRLMKVTSDAVEAVRHRYKAERERADALEKCRELEEELSILRELMTGFSQSILEVAKAPRQNTTGWGSSQNRPCQRKKRSDDSQSNQEPT